jgi:putative serine protease PepD
MEPVTTDPVATRPTSTLPDPRPQARCVRCNAVLVAGRCFLGHDQAPAAPAPIAPPTPAVVADSGPADTPRRPSPLVIALAAALVVSLAVAAIMYTRVQDRVDVLADQLDDLSDSQFDLNATIDSDHRSNEALRTEFENLEATINAPGLAEVAAKVGASVLTVESSSGLGSAFVIRSDGRSSTLVTNLHVVADDWGNGTKNVVVWDGDTRYPATIQRVSQIQDLALLQIGGAFEPLKVARDRVAPGVDVAAIGSPLGLETSISTGVVSGYRPEVGIEVLQFSAAISPGNSGGAVINDKGAVVGIAVGKLTGVGVEGLSFAIPADRICTDLGVC